MSVSGFSGLIYAVIVAAWASVLVPKWLRRNEEIEQAREADAARGVRVLERRDDRYNVSHRPSHGHGSTVFRGAVSSSNHEGESSDLASIAEHQQNLEPPASRPIDHPSAPVVVEPDPDYERAARRRVRVLAVLVAATVVVGVASTLGSVPVWAPAPSGVLLVAFMVAARRAAVAHMYKRRHRMRLAARAVERASADEIEAEAPRVAVLDAPETVPEDPDAWSPVDVPLPTYMTKPVVRRLARTIDLSAAGSWTSGRLDPTSTIEGPPPQRSVDASEAPFDEAVAEELDEIREQRRAVGD